MVNVAESLLSVELEKQVVELARAHAIAHPDMFTSRFGKVVHNGVKHGEEVGAAFKYNGFIINNSNSIIAEPFA